VSIELLREARQHLLDAEQDFNEEIDDANDAAFVSLWDAVDKIHKFLTEYTRKRRR